MKIKRDEQGRIRAVLQKGSENHCWKGETASYSSKHKWIVREAGPAKECRFCGRKSNVDWANISREYKREISDWMQLCRQCHKVFDRKKIPHAKYRWATESLTILCVDILVENDLGTLLVKRKNAPLKGEYWPVGGRIIRKEKPEAAVRRLAFEEAGLHVFGECFIGYYEEFFQDSRFGSKGIHTVSLVFRARTRHRAVKLDKQSSAYKWADALPQRFVRNLKTIASV